VNFTGSAPVRQPVPELPEHDLPIAPGLEETPQGSGDPVVYLRLLWEHRRLIACVVLYGLLASTLIAFLIPIRYESTARLMPPDSNQSGGLAMAAAARALRMMRPRLVRPRLMPAPKGPVPSSICS